MPQYESLPEMTDKDYNKGLEKLAKKLDRAINELERLKCRVKREPREFSVVMDDPAHMPYIIERYLEWRYSDFEVIRAREVL